MTLSIKATLYSRPGCHLCEQAAIDLARLRTRHPHEVDLVDVSSDAALEQQYGQRIPVLNIGGREYDAPLPAAVLERALKSALEQAKANGGTP